MGYYLSTGFVNGLDVPSMIAVGSLETHYGKTKTSCTLENLLKILSWPMRGLTE